MDAISDPSIPVVVAAKAAQVAATELLNNAVGYFIDQDPSSILVLWPTLELGEDWSKDRLAGMLRDTPVIRDKVAELKSRDRDNTLRQKVFPGGRLTIVGANSPASLASRPIRIILADEVDRYPRSAGGQEGRGEGDPLTLAARRQTTFWNRKTYMCSTPTRKETSVIWREWERSDQRRYFVPCPECEFEQYLQWKGVVWNTNSNGVHDPSSACYVCESCGAAWNDVDRWDAIQKGSWKPTATPKENIVGFHIPALLSPFVQLEYVVQEFLKAKGRSHLMQVFTNTILGEPWLESEETVDVSSISSRGELYDGMQLPTEVQLLTAGVDVQGDRLEIQVIGWGFREESWIVDYIVINGDPAQLGIWEELDELLKQSYRTANGRELKIRCTCIDTGGHHANQVLQFCKRRWSRRVFPIKGIAGPRPVWPPRASRTKTNERVFMVGVDAAKDAIYGRLRIKPEIVPSGAVQYGAGYIHFPAGSPFDQDYFDQLTSEVVQTRYREGRPYRVWVLPDSKRNEALDTMVYALAARVALPKRLDHHPDSGSASAPSMPLAGATPKPPGPRVVQQNPQAKKSFASKLAR